MSNSFKRGCNCYRGRRSRWIEPSILYLLWEKSRHGYDLMNDLPELGFFSEQADPGAIYRTLRHLEDNGLVVSEWDTSGSGPAKRFYTITELGKDNLLRWQETIRLQKNALDAFLEKIKVIDRKPKI
ncbi:helix-turn-helix transcriptional regulator [candidate division KSB1 bacterium]|nr:helix-turn-helix transcriptional regulator [candidate division KSB1 bacterium]